MNDIIILGRIGEIALKGLNRSTFEGCLAKNMRKAIAECGKCSVNWSQSRYYITPEEENFNIDLAITKLTKVFGLTSVSKVHILDTNLEKMSDMACILAEQQIQKFKQEGKSEISFKFITKRGLKSFPMNSLEVSSELGGIVLDKFPFLKVDVNAPDFTIYVEVRENTYMYTEIIQAQGGMPVGSNGKACLLISGGIDSPVAGYMVGKRGVTVHAIHFYSYPYTSERAKQKVFDLAKLISEYCGPVKVAVVPYTEVQLAIRDNCCPELGTVIMRRSMMRIAERYARRNGCSALVTGESIGQVASQTIQAIYCTNEAAHMPIFRPLIGMDKMETVAIARRINTYETSIEPYEDCCTIFTPKHPKTKPSLHEILEEEKKFDYITMEDVAYQNIMFE